MDQWYALYTKPRMERKLAAVLAGRDLPVFAPTIDFRNRRGHRVVRPFFPRYIFAQFDWALEGWTSIQWTHGLSHVVRFDGQPAWLDAAQVGYLRHRLERLDGDAFMRLKQGEIVRVTEGPFQNLEAVFDKHLNGAERVAILLEILGRQTRVIVALEGVERVLPVV